MALTVYTDGACLGNPGPGGWAWAVPFGPFASGSDEHTTNQQMEISAALAAVQTLEGALVIVSDSEHVVKCHTERCYKNWEKRLEEYETPAGRQPGPLETTRRAVPRPRR